MPKYVVDVKAFIAVEVEAASAGAARDIAESWVDWLSPTEEQLADYQEDHEGAENILHAGGLSIDGDSDVTELED